MASIIQFPMERKIVCVFNEHCTEGLKIASEDFIQHLNSLPVDYEDKRKLADLVSVLIDKACESCTEVTMRHVAGYQYDSAVIDSNAQQPAWQHEVAAINAAMLAASKKESGE